MRSEKLGENGESQFFSFFFILPFLFFELRVVSSDSFKLRGLVWFGNNPGF